MGWIIMLATVGFDDKAAFVTVEIQDVVTDRHLSPELEAPELPVSKQPPKLDLGVGRITAHSTSEAQEAFVSRRLMRCWFHQRLPRLPLTPTLSRREREKCGYERGD